eukprot:c46094_g1_i1 orf=18-248(+)
MADGRSHYRCNPCILINLLPAQIRSFKKDYSLMSIKDTENLLLLLNLENSTKLTFLHHALSKNATLRHSLQEKIDK